MVQKNNIYYLQSGSLKQNNKFQLMLQNVNNGMYAYSFSLNEKDELKIHWPRDEKIDQTFEGLHESARITVPEVKLILPSPQKALQFGSGKEYLIQLFSAGPIQNFNQKLAKLQKAKGPIYERLELAFGEELLPAGQIRYEKDRMVFRNEIGKGHIIPMVLEVLVE
jgi:hypothetical protein